MIREGRAEAGRSVRYLEAGAGWPLILIHAFPLGAEMWRPQLEHVPDGWRYIAPELPGFGGSPPPPALAKPTMNDYADDVRALLDALGLERAAVGGLSMGGYVTFALFRRAPERFSAAVLADTRAQADTPEGRDARRAMSELVRTKGSSAVADQMIPKLLSRSTRETKPDVEREVRRLIEANDPAGIDGAIHALLTRPDSTPDVARIAIPTLVIVGEEDALTPVAESEQLHRSIARSHLVVLPAAGHLSSLESPVAFSQALADFLDSNL